MNIDKKEKSISALYIKDIISRELNQFLTHVLLRQYHEMKIQEVPGGDEQVKNAMSHLSHDIIFDTALERVWPFLENILNEELIPTYSFARLYTNGNELKKHTDRPSCEVSVTVQLGRSHHYSWPIYAGGERFDLAEGDGVLYKGCEVEHWREKCDGPEGYYSGQAFFHFVRANGPYAEFAGDKRWKGEMSFERYRTLLMETK
jgi:hypothetical protein